MSIWNARAGYWPKTRSGSIWLRTYYARRSEACGRPFRKENNRELAIRIVCERIWTERPARQGRAAGRESGQFRNYAHAGRRAVSPERRCFFQRRAIFAILRRIPARVGLLLERSGS